MELSSMKCLVACKQWREPLVQLCSNSNTAENIGNKQNLGSSSSSLSTSSSRPSSASRPVPEEPHLSLHACEWYWGNISRQEANKILLGTPDGSFVVRDSTNTVGGFTLTLRKGGRNKLIKIIRQNNKYGFCEPFQFNTVANLINYYRHFTLSEYNPTLDTKLLYPISRLLWTGLVKNKYDLNGVKLKLLEINKLYLDKTKIYNVYSDEAESVLKIISDGKQALKAYNETVLLFKKQLDIHGIRQKQIEPHEKTFFQNNYEVLEDRFLTLIKSRDDIESSIVEKENYYRKLHDKVNKLQLELMELTKNIDKMKGWLLCHGEKIQNIELLLSGKPIINEKLVHCPHNDERSWRLTDCSRERAEELLSGKRDGTFLVRPSRRGQEALSVVCDGKIHHCIIHKTQRGYGFTEPFNIFKSLKELVLHYYETSLEEYNDILHVTLEFPVFSPRPEEKSTKQSIDV